ncbi:MULTISPECIES: spore protease YyaC [Paenibacillus]|jgi:putative sporulation protein YyaC|uniref:Spore protease YyaC n=1 Tax=Paenibacillus oceani TaxID=2772510 RepID=A0A927C4L1_9BACL|nr:spore protease YyaC [Paenibacillus oceani]MBD2860709.1 spore protease YyaC [Paenibacillus oceani]
MKFPLGFLNKTDTASTRFNYSDANVVEALTQRLYQYFTQVPSRRQIVFVCIGTDRSTGDSLGPLIGTQLRKYHYSGLHLFGTLDEPVHAMNLADTIAEIDRLYDSPFVVALDACLGQVSSVGCITVADGPVKPGAGVQKELPPVGDMHITGIVNVGGFMEYFVLQNTRLSVVMNMSEIISRSIFRSLLIARRITSAQVPNID